MLLPFSLSTVRAFLSSGDDYLGADGKWRPQKLPQVTTTCVSIWTVSFRANAEKNKIDS